MNEERSKLVSELAPISLHTRNIEPSWLEIMMALANPTWRSDEMTASQALDEAHNMHVRFQKLLDLALDTLQNNVLAFRHGAMDEDISETEEVIKKIKETRPND